MSKNKFNTTIEKIKSQMKPTKKQKINESVVDNGMVDIAKKIMDAHKPAFEELAK